MVRRAWLPTLAVALLTVPTCSALTKSPAPVVVAACVRTVAPPLGTWADGTRAVLPAIPAWVPSTIDSVPIRFVHHLKCNDETAVGCFTYAKRVIELEDTLSAYNRWLTLRHEIVHSALYDAGLRFRDGPTEDVVADAIAAQQVREMVAGWPR